MSIVITFAPSRSTQHAVEVSATSEFLATLHVLAESEHHSDRREWIDSVRSSWSDSLRFEFGHFSPLWSRYRCRAFYPMSASDEASDVIFDQHGSPLKAPSATLTGTLKRGILGSSRATLGATDAEFVSACALRSQARGDLAQEFTSAPDAFIARLFQLLQNLHNNYFADLWEQLKTPLVAEATRLTRALHEFDTITVLASLHTSITATHSGNGVRIDKLQNLDLFVDSAPLVIVPSIFASPHVTVKSEAGLPWVLHYPIPISGEVTAPQPLSLAQLRDRLAALLAPSRMEVCRHVLAEPMTTSDIAERMQTSPQHISRALKSLREVGLVASQRRGKYVYHRLDTEAIQRLGPDVLATIMR